MSIRSVVNNTIGNVGDTIETLVTNAKSTISNIVGTATTGIGNLYSGGFVGMSREGMEQLNTAVENYCQTIEEAINEFNDEASRADAYAGEISDAVHEYVEGMKKMLSAYVSTMRKDQEEAAKAFNAFHSSEQSISQDVTSDAGDIKSNAESIRVESSKISLE